MCIRRLIVLMIPAILLGCGEAPQTPAEEKPAAPEQTSAQPATEESPPEGPGMTSADPADEEPAAAENGPPITPPVDVVQVDEGAEEVVATKPGGEVMSVPPLDETEPAGEESDDVGGISTDEAEDPPVVDPPLLPVQEQAAEEADDSEDDADAASTPGKEEEPGEVEVPADPVVALLDELEQSASDLRTFTADVLYQTEDALLGQKVSRKGAIAYAVDAETNHKKFAIRFTEIIESGRMRRRNKYYIFNDRWLVEIDDAEKTFIKREIVPPGSTFDPLKLGEGPFPLPIGQARREVLARFEVELIELPAEGALARLRDTFQVHGLRLKPKSEAREAEDFDHIDLFYDKDTLLPVGVEVIEANGDRKTARLEEPRRNPELADDFSVAEPDPTVWRIDVRPWQDRP